VASVRVGFGVTGDPHGDREMSRPDSVRSRSSFELVMIRSSGRTRAHVTAREFVPPTEAERRRGFTWRAVGGGAMALALVTFVVLLASNEKPLQGPHSQAAAGAIVSFGYGLAAFAWGLRPVAQQRELDSVRVNGVTFHLVGYCTVVAVMFAAAPIVLLVAVMLGP
jgi:hypothetical protein